MLFAAVGFNLHLQRRGLRSEMGLNNDGLVLVDRLLSVVQYVGVRRLSTLDAGVKMTPFRADETASFDVDPQRGFTPLCPDELPVADGHTIVDELNRQARLARYRLVSKDSHPAEAPWVAREVSEILTPVAGEYPNLDLKWPAHCVVGTEGHRLLPGLPDEGDYDLLVEKGMDPEKHPYGACFHDLLDGESTGVIEWLRARNVTTVLAAGLATDYCLKTTALQLKRAGFRVIVNLAGCRGVAAESSEAAIAEMAACGIELVAAADRLCLREGGSGV